MKTTTAKKKGILSVLMLLAGTVVFAQRPSLPVTSAEFAPGTVRRQARAEERAERNARFIARQDSLVQSCNFQFLPSACSRCRRRRADDQQHLLLPRRFPRPYRGAPAYAEGLPESLCRGTQFRCAATEGLQGFEDPVGLEYFVQCGRRGGNVYTFGINLFTATGEAIMTMLTPRSTIKYVGSLAAMSRC